MTSTRGEKTARGRGLRWTGLSLLGWAAAAHAQTAATPRLGLQPAGPEQLQLELSGTAGRTYQLESSSNLVNWVGWLTTNSLTSNLDLTLGSGQVGLGPMFYRALDLGAAAGGGGPDAVFTLIWSATSGPLARAPRISRTLAAGGRVLPRQGSTTVGSVVFAVKGADGRAVTNQVVNLPSGTNQITVEFSGLPSGAYTVVADAFPQAAGGGVPFLEARYSFVITAGAAPATATFTLADVPVVGLLLGPANPTVAIGGTTLLDAAALDASNQVVFIPSQTGALTWSSLDTAVATVDLTGKVTGVGAGSSSIQVALATNLALATNITVNSSLQDLALFLNPSSVVLPLGQMTNLTLSATNAAGDPVTPAASALTWASSSPATAIVNGTGRVMGVAPGLAIISVSEPLLAQPPPQVQVSVVLSTNSPSSPGGVPPPAHGYWLTDLGSFAGNLSSEPAAINDNGHVVGTAWAAADPFSSGAGSGPPGAFIWKPSFNNQMTGLPDLGGGQAEAIGLNNSDQVVGWS
ncbi:MAG: Ig-like domain-containing protein, partial [Verrucomicrobia bacterium]|nr:Ig-like domain-containing protein [Verrucomicrobiota bacterium]